MSALASDLQLDDHNEPDPPVAECVDPRQVQSWILDCEDNHGGRCNSTEHQPATPVTELKFIDVVDQCIVDATPNARYFALSYMWGGVTQMILTTENDGELSLPGSLQQHWGILPAVIQDAIDFVVALGERYLWVDSLCIVQNNLQMKHDQILQMGAIYNGAVACLVGAVGTNANSGLAGVRPSTRTPEHKRPQYQNFYLVNPGPEEYTSLRKPMGNTPYVSLGRRVKARELDLIDRLMKSNYSSRAWTYQERLLSRRCIYFMENMVYFHCRTAIRGENKATPYSQKSQNIRPLCLFMADPIFSGDPFHYQKTLGAIYAGIVTEFTRKKLSFPLDVLDAFSGISSAMEKLCSWKFVAGIPEALIDHALLWRPAAPCQRRSQQPDNPFPSWSWAGWHVEADYDTLLRVETGYEPYLADMESLVYQLSIQDRHGHHYIRGSVPVNEYFAKLAIEAGRSLRTEFSYWVTRISNSQSPKNVLVFQALTWPWSDCGVFSTETREPFLSVVRPSLGPIQRKFVFFRFSGAGSVGTLLSAGPEILSITEPSSYDVIFLSINKAVGEDFDEWNRHSGFTNFMLIKWTGEFAERVAIGHMSELLNMQTGGKHHIEGNATVGDYLLRGSRWKTIRLI